ncbi:MAG TPA: hypothetical protein VJ917_10990 [Saprospiraceae bacterium]|nr:hypothetical protein [Saprospiraceae bacterium]
MKRIILVICATLLFLGFRLQAAVDKGPSSLQALVADSLTTSLWLEIIPDLKHELFAEELIPLNLLNCSVENIENRYVILNWAEAIPDMPSKMYEIQRYDYDKGWLTIRKINSAKKAFGNYSYLDRQPYRGHSFYRIIQYDQEGQVFGSEVLPVSLYDPLEYIFDYDVMTGQATLESGNGSELSDEVLIFDLSGEQILKGVQIERSNGKLYIELGPELSGMYLIKCESFITQVFRPDFSSIKN